MSAGRVRGRFCPSLPSHALIVLLTIPGSKVRKKQSCECRDLQYCMLELDDAATSATPYYSPKAKQVIFHLNTWTTVYLVD